MRGESRKSDGMFSYVRLEERVPQDHTWRAICALVDAVLLELSPGFAELYVRVDRPSVPPEHLLRGLFLQAFYTIRSKRLPMKELDYNLRFRWFVGQSIGDGVWDTTVLFEGRGRLLEGDIGRWFMAGVLNLPQVKKMLFDEHISADGTLNEA